MAHPRFVWRLYIGVVVFALVLSAAVAAVISRKSEAILRDALLDSAIPLRHGLKELSSVTLSVTLAASIGAIVLGYFIARWLTRPVEDLARAAGSISSGRYDQRLATPAHIELSRVADAFNRLADQLQTRVHTVSVERNMLAAILGGMVEGIVAIDKEGTVIHMNAVAGSFLGISPSQSIGRSSSKVIQVAEIPEILADTVRKEHEVLTEVVLSRRPRRDLTIEMHSSPLRDGEGVLIGAVVVIHDVTDLRRLEAIRRDFVANVSHELKTPITAIRGISETMLDDVEMDGGTRARFLAKLQNQAVRLSDLVSDLLTLARLESGDGVLTSSTLDLRDPIRYAVNAILGVIEEHGVVFEADVPKSPVMVTGDEQSLRQMINNLIDNAVKYTPKGGRVWLRAKRVGELAIIEVQDTGVGVESHHLDRLFERFYRVDKARSRELGGTGLGLSIVKHVCLAHGGEVSVESTPGEGSTFRVRLPIAPEE